MTTRESRVQPESWWFDFALIVGFVALTWVLNSGGLLGVDLSVRNWVDSHQPETLHVLARAGNLLGQGGFFTAVAGVLALLLSWRRHSIRPLLPVAFAFILTLIVITTLKDWTNRAAPHANTDTPPIFNPERFGSGGISYPSGHLCNALVWYGVLALLLSVWLPQRWRRAIRIIPPVILSVTTVYLGFHWISDTVAGILLGLFMWRLVARVPWDDLPLGSYLARNGWDQKVWTKLATHEWGQPVWAADRNARPQLDHGGGSDPAAEAEGAARPD